MSRRTCALALAGAPFLAASEGRRDIGLPQAFGRVRHRPALPLSHAEAVRPSPYRSPTLSASAFSLPALHCARLDDAQEINRAILERFEQVRYLPELRRTHLIAGRYENLYVPESVLPELRPVVKAALEHARRILGERRLTLGFWLNAMEPGQSTSRHTHDDDDELLVGVYYASAPADSGDLVLIQRGVELRLHPEEGLFVFFEPTLAHEVEANLSGRMRLSVAFNFGPAEAT